MPGFFDENDDGTYCTDYDECREECWPIPQNTSSYDLVERNLTRVEGLKDFVFYI